MIWTGEGKSGKTLQAFFDELGPKRTAELQVVAMDMSPAYERVAREQAPKADVVFG